MKNSLLALVAFAGLAGAAQADSLFIDLSGWQSSNGYGGSGNTNLTISLPAGTEIKNIFYTNLAFATQGDSWLRELVISVNDSFAGVGGFWDHNPSNTAAGGVFGPAAGAFPDPGLFASGPFTMSTNQLYIETYERFTDPGVNAIISSGTLEIVYTLVPTPGAAALLGLGGLMAARRRRA